MDKLKQAWKKLTDEGKDLRKDLKKSLGPQPQAFKGAGHKLGDDSTPKVQVAAGPSQQNGSSGGTPAARPASAASSAAAEAALARLQAKNKPAAPRAAAKPWVPSTNVASTTLSSHQAMQPKSPQTDAAAPSAPDYQSILHMVEDEVLQEAFTALVTDDKFAASGPVLLKVLGNIAAQPAEAKFRKLRMNNAKVQAALVDTQGALELMQLTGFMLHFETNEGQEEGYLVFPEDAEMGRLKAAVSVLAKLLPGHAPPKAPAVSSPWQRNTCVLLPVETDASVPDWFFDFTGAELKAAYAAAVKKREASQMLMTSAMREQLMGSKVDPSKYSHALIRVRLPEGLILQGDFRPSETTADVCCWVSKALSCPELPYELVLPQRRPLEPSATTLRDADLLPNTLLNFHWLGDSKINMAERPTLKQELIQQALPADQEHH